MPDFKYFGIKIHGWLQLFIFFFIVFLVIVGLGIDKPIVALFERLIAWLT